MSILLFLKYCMLYVHVCFRCTLDVCCIRACLLWVYQNFFWVGCMYIKDWYVLSLWIPIYSFDIYVQYSYILIMIMKMLWNINRLLHIHCIKHKAFNDRLLYLLLGWGGIKLLPCSVEILENVCMHPPVLIIKFIVLMIDNQNRKVFFWEWYTLHLYYSDSQSI